MDSKALSIRLAAPEDIPELHRIRMAVKENRLSDPNAISSFDYLDMMHEKGRTWVCQLNGRIVGFAAIDINRHNVWALFVHPDYEQLGIGQALQTRILQFAAMSGLHKLWLTTDPRTRAEAFYRRSGWKETRREKNGGIRFELNILDWLNRF